MSNNTISQQPYADKSMNGIITYDDGSGTVISGGVITTDTFSTTNFNSDNIQGIAPDNDISLYTDTSGLASIQLGSAVTGTTFVDGNVVYVNGTNTVTFTAGSLMDFRSPTIRLNTVTPTDPVTACDVKIVSNTVEPNTVANGLAIGSTITSANLTLGNATYPPSCTATATSANHICNYSTVQSLISAGGSLLSSNNTWSGTNRFNNTLQSAYIFQTDSIDPLTTTAGTVYYLYGSVPNVSYIFFGSVTSTSTSEVYINPNNGLVNIGVGYNRSASVNINSGPTCSGDVNILTGTDNTGDFNVGTSLTYGGDIRFSTGTGSANTFTVGTTTTSTILLRGATVSLSSGTAVNINTGANLSTTTIGNSASPSTTNIFGLVNIGTSGGQNTNIGHTTAQTNILGSPLNLNATSTQNTRIGSVSNTGTITIGNASSTALEIGKPMTPIYTTYTINTGTNVVETIGYVISGVHNGGGTINASPRESSSINITDNGVYVISYSQAYVATANGTLARVVGYIQLLNQTGAVQTEGGQSSVFGALTTAQTQYFSGTMTYTVTNATSVNPWRARCLIVANITSGTYVNSNTFFQFTAVRIA
jgi:hypothetical protein